MHLGTLVRNERTIAARGRPPDDGKLAFDREPIFFANLVGRESRFDRPIRSENNVGQDAGFECQFVQKRTTGSIRCYRRGARYATPHRTIPPPRAFIWAGVGVQEQANFGPDHTSHKRFGGTKRLGVIAMWTAQ